MRHALIVVLLVGAGCKDAQEKAKEAVKKADNVVDKATSALDLDEVQKRLATVKDALAKNLEALDDCGWASRAGDVADAAKAPLAELKKLCTLDLPLARAGRAVARVERAKQEQPEAPSYTECSDDDWPKVKKLLDDTHPGEARWTDLKARWTKVCPSS
ncbi:MAG: hypothetical protein KIT31_30025 [Deltaproteobacteria bacterium]|nr:hypothetical protein [Deltaproteobacteria bacterium]